MVPVVGDFPQADGLVEGKNIVAVGPNLNADGATLSDARGIIGSPALHWHAARARTSADLTQKPTLRENLQADKLSTSASSKQASCCCSLCALARLPESDFRQ